ncbi:MAG: SAF domain-containing protein [Actinomycetota bacterium]|nr:SAF domain-containing protein [Actinomycetota bacterium]
MSAAGGRVRSRVRTQWLALGAALVVLAGVLVAWALTQAADRVQVVQVAQAVPAGEVIEAADLTVTGVAFDAEVQGLVPAGSLEKLVGRVAAVDMQPGSLLQVGMWRDAPQLAAGEESVGALLQLGRFPAGLVRGDLAVAAPLDAAGTGPVVVVRVIDLQVLDDGDLSVTLAVAQADSVSVAQLAANDQLVLVGRAQEVAP